MSGHWTDDFGDDWEVDVILEGEEHPDTGEPLTAALIRFGNDDRSMEMSVRGDVEDVIDELDDDRLELAMEAAKDARGFLFVDGRGRFWWVKGAKDDSLNDLGSPLTFDDGVNQLRHPGPLAAPPHDLTDDELEELLAEARGVAA